MVEVAGYIIYIGYGIVIFSVSVSFANDSFDINQSFVAGIIIIIVWV